MAENYTIHSPAGKIKEELIYRLFNYGLPYKETEAYSVGDYCTNGYYIYKCITDIPEGGEAWTADHWRRIAITDELKAIRAEILDLSNIPRANEVSF